MPWLLCWVEYQLNFFVLLSFESQTRTQIILNRYYYSLIYPYISNAILAWGGAYKTRIGKIQTKQNHSARLIFFATAYGKHTESALPLVNLLEVLTVHNVYRFQILKFTYLWHKGFLPKLSSNYFQYASNVHKYNTRYRKYFCSWAIVIWSKIRHKQQW